MNYYKKLIGPVKEAGNVLKKYFSQNLEIREKSGPADVQTKADTESERIIVTALETLFPSYNIFSEECQMKDNGSPYTFILDPLDGSHNFIKGIPYFSIALALVKGNDIIFSVTYNPLTDQIYWADSVKGVYLGNRKISVNKNSQLARATIAYCQGYSVTRKEGVDIFNTLMAAGVERVFWNWSVALDLSLLAEGRIEAMINNKSEHHDFMAGKLLVEKAGGLITNFQGKKVTSKENVFLASNGTRIHKEILEIIHKSKCWELLTAP